ncbi:MAG: recombinase family protein [Syntrophomonas sp.]|nr:recombinase family protein [Syntrophomonas sp.]
MERKVIKIAARPIIAPDTVGQIKKRRVAAYARVSTSSEEQLVSFQAQRDYYTNYILAYPNWEFAGIYVDEGISGVSRKKREGFNRMVEDALDGCFDLIITKSISRFARNTVDSLSTIRLLKDKGVEVYFEKEQIFTFDSKGEFMITLLSSMAQEESRSISENVKWGCRKRMADGKYSLPYKQFLGYQKGADNKPEIVAEEARIIRYIYRLFLEGRTPSNIAAILKAEGVPSPAGKRTWQVNTVISVLTNEKYYGAALLQKTYTEDFISKKSHKNKGELPQYYIESDHEPIVSKEVFDEVQSRLNLPEKDNPSHNTFANRIICGDCGGKYGRKPVSSYRDNKKYHHFVWKCNHRYDRAENCKTPHLYEEVIIYAFNEAVQSIIKNNPELVEVCCRMVFSSIRADKSVSKAERKQMITDYIPEFLEASPKEIPFSEAAWRIMLEQVVIMRDRRMIMYFINGNEYTYILPYYSPIRGKHALE